MSSSTPQTGSETPTSTRHDSLRAAIARVLRDHQPPTHVDPAGLPPDEFDCCADAVMAVVLPAIEAERQGESGAR